MRRCDITPRATVDVLVPSSMSLAPRELAHASLGQRPREKFAPKRALKVRIKIAEEDVEVNRAVSTGEFFSKNWDVAPG